MKTEIKRMVIAMVIPLFIIFIMYMLKIMETGMAWDLTSWGVYPHAMKGLCGVLTHPLVHSSFGHLFANTIPLFFLSWCLFFFYRSIAPLIMLLIWIGCGLLLFFIGHPGWHVGASGVIYGLAFFLFFSGLLRRHIPLIAISLLVTFLYGGLIWNMFPFFAKPTTSWEGHLSGAITGIFAAFVFINHGPQKQEMADDEEDDEEEEEGEEAGDEDKSKDEAAKTDIEEDAEA